MLRLFIYFSSSPRLVSVAQFWYPCCQRSINECSSYVLSAQKNSSEGSFSTQHSSRFKSSSFPGRALRVDTKHSHEKIECHFWAGNASNDDDRQKSSLWDKLATLNEPSQWKWNIFFILEKKIHEKITFGCRSAGGNYNYQIVIVITTKVKHQKSHIIMIHFDKIQTDNMPNNEVRMFFLLFLSSEPSKIDIQPNSPSIACVSH